MSGGAGAPTGETFRTASVQASSVWLDKAATTEKTCALIAEAGRGGARIVALPESFVPGFPYWLFTMKLHDATGFHRRLHDEAVEIPGPEVAAIERAAIEAGVTAVVGITERDPGHLGTLFNTNAVFGPEGYLGKHRKLVPTWAERVVWTGGDGSTLGVFETPQGPLGTLCCGENVNTLARYALLGEGERVHVANFPSCAPLGGLHEDTNEVYLPAAAHAYEGRLYNVVAQEFGTPEVCEAVGVEYVPEAWNCISGTIGPDGNWVQSARDEEAIVYADCDPGATTEGRIFHDIVGHYNRFDVLQLHVDRTSRGPLVSSHNGAPAEERSDLTYLTTPDGVRLRYTDRGDGERTIVLVHGWKGSHRLWDPAVVRLAERFRVVAFDNRGMGESDKPGGPYDFDVLADDLGVVLAQLGVEDATLVGWSMGCSIGLQYLDGGGGRVSRLVLVNGPIVLRSSPDFPFGMENEQLDGYLEGLAAGWPQAELDFVRESMREPDGAFSQFSFQVAMQTPLEMAMRIVRAQGELDHREALANLKLPVLALYGGLDPYYPEALAEWIADRAQDGRYEIFENSAHAAHHDEADRFAAVVGAFAEED